MKKHELMNAYLSDLAILNTKLHNLHWNVVGVNFVAIHNFTESLYDEAFAQLDAVAEQIKMDGGMPLSKVKDYLANSQIEEIDPKAFSTKEVLEILLQDLQYMKNKATEIRTVADEANDPITVSMFEDYIASYNKHIWFLNAMSQ